MTSTLPTTGTPDLIQPADGWALAPTDVAPIHLSTPTISGSEVDGDYLFEGLFASQDHRFDSAPMVDAER